MKGSSFPRGDTGQSSVSQCLSSGLPGIVVRKTAEQRGAACTLPHSPRRCLAGLHTHAEPWLDFSTSHCQPENQQRCSWASTVLDSPPSGVPVGGTEPRCKAIVTSGCLCWETRCETVSLVGREIGREGPRLGNKGANFQDGQLLHPPDLEWKHHSLKQRPCGLLPLTRRRPCWWILLRKLKACSGQATQHFCQINLPSVLQVDQPQMTGGTLLGALDPLPPNPFGFLAFTLLCRGSISLWASLPL